jgi:NAD(P)-dependent dehydrogenase (short-subunit alcohol dehydrogenase family)
MMPSDRYALSPTCVIAGAGPGLGLAVAERYAREGFAVYLLSRSPDLLAAPVVLLQSRDLNVRASECDVDSTISIEYAIRAIEAESGSCDVLVYNAFVDDAELPVNVSYAAAFVQLIVNAMRARGGALLFSDYWTADASKHNASHIIGKAPLRLLVDHLADELEPVGVRVGMVTIHGALPDPGPELASLANLYWELFFSAAYEHERELHFRTSRPSY